MSKEAKEITRLLKAGKLPPLFDSEFGLEHIKLTISGIRRYQNNKRGLIK